MKRGWTVAALLLAVVLLLAGCSKPAASLPDASASVSVPSASSSQAPPSSSVPHVPKSTPSSASSSSIPISPSRSASSAPAAVNDPHPPQLLGQSDAGDTWLLSLQMYAGMDTALAGSWYDMFITVPTGWTLEGDLNPILYDETGVKRGWIPGCHLLEGGLTLKNLLLGHTSYEEYTQHQEGEYQQGDGRTVYYLFEEFPDSDGFPFCYEYALQAEADKAVLFYFYSEEYEPEVAVETYQPILLTIAPYY